MVKIPYIAKEKFRGKTEEARQRQLENLLVGRAKRVLDTFFLKEEKKTLIEAHTGTLAGKGSL